MGSRSLFCDIASESVQWSLIQCLNGVGGMTNERVAWSGITHFIGPYSLLKKITRYFMKERISQFNCKTYTRAYVYTLYS
jgi:hypothetical protein